jgi:Transposase IS116/IS110/IS902 family
VLARLDAVDAQLAALDHRLEQVAATEPWSDPVRWLCSFRGISTRTALGLLAEIGDSRRFASGRELMGFLGLTPSESLPFQFVPRRIDPGGAGLDETDRLDTSLVVTRLSPTALLVAASAVGA